MSITLPEMTGKITFLLSFNLLLSMGLGKLFIIKTKENNNNNNQIKMKNNKFSKNIGKNKPESGMDHVNEFDYQDLITGKESLKHYLILFIYFILQGVHQNCIHFCFLNFWAS